MVSKKDMIERLRAHPLFKAALASVNKEQAEKIATIAEGFLGRAADGLVPMIQQATDPTIAASAREALTDTKSVVKNEPVSSGSKE